MHSFYKETKVTSSNKSKLQMTFRSLLMIDDNDEFNSLEVLNFLTSIMHSIISVHQLIVLTHPC